MDHEIEILGSAENENDNGHLIKYEKKTKAYMNSYNMTAYLKERIDKDPKIEFHIKDVFNDICGFAKKP